MGYCIVLLAEQQDVGWQQRIQPGGGLLQNSASQVVQHGRFGGTGASGQSSQHGCTDN